MALRLQPVQDLQGITRLRRIDPIAVEHLEPIKDDNSILGAGSTSQHAKRVADQLLSVGLGHKSREPRILWCNLPELVVQREAGNRIHHVTEVDTLFWAKPRLFSKRDAFGPLLQRLGLTLIGYLKGRHLFFLQPLAHVAQSILGLVEIH